MAPKARRYELSRAAQADLDSVFGYTQQRWSVQQAEHYIRQLFTAFQAIAAGDAIDRQTELGLLKYVVNRHVVYYRRTEAKVIIVRILHGSMDAPRHLGSSLS